MKSAVSVRKRPEIIVLQHAPLETSGLLGTAIRAGGFAPRVVHGYAGEVPADLQGARGLCILGGPMGVHDTRKHPFLARELRLIERALRAKVPVLGVCLGSQLLATALGARVRTAKAKEIGWYPLTLRPACAKDPLFSGIDAFVPLHWHGDIFALPKGAVPLAASERTRVQAYRHDPRTYGLLFHMELTLPMARRWARAFKDELDEDNVPPARIVKGAERHIARTSTAARAIFGRWTALCER